MKVFIITSVVNNNWEGTSEVDLAILDAVTSEQAARKIMDAARKDAEETYEDNDIAYEVRTYPTMITVETTDGDESITIQIHEQEVK